ncbi:protein LAZ1, partial [Tanacetum coccineum]
MCNAIRDFFGNGKLLKEINHTFLALIPKISTPSKVNDYPPISCCNVIYKCISKILTNCIIDGIKEVVSENQSAFVPGRRISDNILITQELMHNYHRDRGPPRCAFKVDIQKAYDTVDWRFLGFILKCFGFPSMMIKWIMACVTSTSFSISINGDIHGLFQGKRGLRQGDPLSLYLFTLVMEVLTLILHRRVRLSDTLCYHHNCEELNIINVCFVDDLFLFTRGEMDLAKLIMDALDEFKMVSGLVPSILKSTAFFCNVANHVKAFILNIMPFWRKSFLESLWVHWIHTHKLQGRTIWDIQPKGDMSWGWRKLLQLREFVKPFFWIEIRNGLSASLWYDRWCSLSPLSRFLSPRDIAREGYTLQACVTDLILNGTWNWPQPWLAKAPNIGNIGNIVAPILNINKHDCLKWRDDN